jgi:hypothetical protein
MRQYLYVGSVPSSVPVSEGIVMAKMVYLSERGDDKNDGLTEQTPVLTCDRAIKIALKEKTQQFYVTDGYCRHMLEKKKAAQETLTHELFGNAFHY